MGWFRWLLLPSVLLTLSCASVLTGTTETIKVDSAPQGADAALFCGVRPVDNAVTPARFTIARNAGNCTLTVSKTGYQSQTASIEQGVNPFYWVNFVTLPALALAAWHPVGAVLLYGGGAGAGVVGGSGFLADLSTGAIHAHRPKNVRVTLQPR